MLWAGSVEHTQLGLAPFSLPRLYHVFAVSWEVRQRAACPEWPQSPLALSTWMPQLPSTSLSSGSLGLPHGAAMSKRVKEEAVRASGGLASRSLRNILSSKNGTEPALIRGSGKQPPPLDRKSRGHITKGPEDPNPRIGRTVAVIPANNLLPESELRNDIVEGNCDS